MSTNRFPIRIGARSRGIVRLLFGATPETAWAEVGPAGLQAQFGRFAFRTPLERVVSWRIEGPFRWITAIGVRMSLRHRDVSFAGSPHGGVRLDFSIPVRWGRLQVPAFYAGVDDLDGFAAALSALGVPGVDARRG
ncbi:MAG: hypothetical protein HYX54_04150 [Chloroflexi bacterium]|nr:hypothetical protein [Chloroflexota bacterium]